MLCLTFVPTLYLLHCPYPAETFTDSVTSTTLPACPISTLPHPALAWPDLSLPYNVFVLPAQLGMAKLCTALPVSSLAQPLHHFPLCHFLLSFVLPGRSITFAMFYICLALVLVPDLP